MKKLLLLAFLGILAHRGFSQVMVDDIDIETLDIQYMEVYGAVGLGGVVRVNYGQATPGPFANYGPLLDPEGKPYKNHIAALNYLYLKGWELYLPSIQKGDATAPSYLLQRRKD